MIRTQIQLPEPLHRALRKWAARRHISLAEAVRRCVTDVLEKDESAPSRDVLLRDALSVIGKYRDPSGTTAVGREHDRHLPEAYRK